MPKNYNPNNETYRHRMFNNSDPNGLQIEDVHLSANPQAADEEQVPAAGDGKKNKSGKKTSKSIADTEKPPDEATEDIKEAKTKRSKQFDKAASLEILGAIVQGAGVLKYAAATAAADAENKNFKQFLQAQADKYDKLIQKAKGKAAQCKLEIGSVSVVTKFLHTANVSLKLFTANTASKVAETLIMETVFSSLTLLRLIRNSKNIQPRIMLFARETVENLEADVQLVKNFL